MRRRIRLTGRKQLAKSSVSVTLAEIGGKPLITMTIVDQNAFRTFPPEAKVTLRLVENKRVEVLDFGTLRRMSSTKELRSRGMVAPSCQLRVVDPGVGQRGLLLASTDGWTIRAEDPGEPQASRGILNFLPDNTEPQPWKLHINDDDYPLVKVDKRIPNAAMWAKSDAAFVGVALPLIVRQILDEILRGDYSEDAPWVADWLRWAAAILPGEPLPEEDDKPARLEFIERLLNSFCGKHDLADKLLASIQSESTQ
jgi:hypothetical protein